MIEMCDMTHSSVSHDPHLRGTRRVCVLREVRAISGLQRAEMTHFPLSYFFCRSSCRCARRPQNDLEDSEPKSAISMTQKTSNLIPGGANKRTIGRPKFNPSMH